MFSLKQDGTFEKFLAEFEYLNNKISDLTEDQKLDLFLRGVRTKTKLELKLRNVLTLDDAIKIATTLEGIREQTSKVESITYVKQMNNTKMNCNYCKKSGHITKDCYKAKAKNSNEPSKKPINYGHKSNPPNDNKNNNPKQMSKPFEKPENKTVIRCNRCQKTGHIAKDCRVKMERAHYAKRTTDNNENEDSPTTA